MRKKCKFEGCKRFPVIGIGSGGMCWEHQSEESKDKRTHQQKRIFKSAMQSRVRKLNAPDDEEKIALKKWFEYHTKNNEKKCRNCGISLAHYNDNDWYGSQHHVLPKEHFPSQAGNIHNHMVLGKWCCHGQWHSSYKNASNMKCFPFAKAIAQHLYKQLPFEERRRFPEVFLD